MHNTLPKIPSRLIRTALLDLEACIEAGYTVNMNRWVNYRDHTCSVCLAGACMVSRMGIEDSVLNASDLRSLSENETISEDDRRRLQALDFFRQGMMQAGFAVLDLPREKVSSFLPVADPAIDVDGFMTDMRNMVRYLESVGH